MAAMTRRYWTQQLGLQHYTKAPPRVSDKVPQEQTSCRTLSNFLIPLVDMPPKWSV
jgi:hypothetical protein